MKVKQLFVLIFSLIAAAVIVTLAVSFTLIKEMHDLERVAEVRYESYLRADELRQSSDDLTRLARTYVTTGDARYRKMYEDILAIRNGQKARPQNYHQVYWDLVIEYGEKPSPDGQLVALQELMKQLGFTEKEFALLKEAQNNSDQLVSTEVAAFKAMEEGRQAYAVEIMHDLAYHKEKAKIMEPINRFLEELESRSLTEVEGAEVSIMQLLYFTAGLLVLVGVLATVGYLLILRKVAVPIGHVSAAIVEVEKNADLTRRISMPGKDEISLMAQSLDKMIERFGTLLTGVNQVTHGVVESVRHTGRFTNETSDRMDRQSEEVETLATALNEISVALSDVAMSTSNAAGVANDAYAHVDASKQVVGASLDTMNDLLQQMRQTSESADELAANFRGIESVLDVIKNIAAQTNLLALNAAIEAARAGESGRGFAVVADEVRTLAQRTQDSTGEIESMISALSLGMDQTVESIRDGMAQVDKSNAAVVDTSVFLNQLNDSVNQIRDMNAQIATATEEQSVVIEGINQSVIHVKDLATGTSSATQELKQTLTLLDSAAGELTERLAVFRV